MKRFLLICLILITAGSLVAQTPTVASLTTTSGTAIQWYSAATGGTLYNGTEALVNGQHYYASQTVNGVESTARLEVIATVTVIPAAPTAASHVITQTQIDWKWSAVSGATGYKWSATNNYGTATDLGNVLIKAESALTCGTSYTRYIWAYNTTACGSTAATFTQSTTPCVSAPTLTTSAVTNIGSTTATFNGNITAINGANVTTRGFKYYTVDGFNPATTGTNISETAIYSAGAFSLSPSGLSTLTTYYVVAYATNSAGTTYGSQVSFNTLIQTDYAYTGSLQTFTVPAGITSITIESWGAEGGTSTAQSGSTTYAGGKGAYIKGTFAVTQGESITLLVAGKGSNGTCGAAGGGGSFAVNSGTLLIAAGGGGGGFHCTYYGGAVAGNGLASGSGGNGIQATGGSATPEAALSGGSGGNGGIAYYGGGGGGWFSAGTSTTGGSSIAGGAYPGAGGTTGGGYGGGGGNYDGCCGGAGGGGGYSGGSGGSKDGCAGGGGGSYNGGTSQTNTAGSSSGNGRILISY